MPTVCSTRNNFFKSANTQWLGTEHQQLRCDSSAVKARSSESFPAELIQSIKMPQFLRPGHSDMSSQAHVFSEPQGNDTSGNDATLSLLLRRENYSTIFSGMVA